MVEQVLVQLDGLGDEETTCEDVKHLRQNFPHINLEDKVFSLREAIVTTHEKKGVDDNRSKRSKPLLVYKRQAKGILMVVVQVWQRMNENNDYCTIN